MSKKSWPFLCCKLPYKIVQDLFDIQYIVTGRMYSYPPRVRGEMRLVDWIFDRTRGLNRKDDLPYCILLQRGIFFNLRLAAQLLFWFA